MTNNIEIDELLWEERNEIHISRHAVGREEVEEACERQVDVVAGKYDRYMLFGKTKEKRYLTVILARVAGKTYYVVTARDSSRKEKRYAKEKEEPDT